MFKKSILFITSAVIVIGFLSCNIFADSAAGVLRVTRGGIGIDSVTEGQFIVGDSIDSMKATSSISIDSTGNITMTKKLTVASLAITGVVVGNIQLDDNYLTNDGDNEGIRIDDSGNVGIATATPAYDLDVYGDIRGAYYSADGVAGYSGNCLAASSTVIKNGIITECN